MRFTCAFVNTKIEDRSDKTARFMRQPVSPLKFSSPSFSVAQVRHSVMRSFSTWQKTGNANLLIGELPAPIGRLAFPGRAQFFETRAGSCLRQKKRPEKESGRLVKINQRNLNPI
jgi:hypothetical protein